MSDDGVIRVQVTLVNGKLHSGKVRVPQGQEEIGFWRTPADATWKLTNIAIWPEDGTEPDPPSVADPPFSHSETGNDGGVLTVMDNNPEDGKKETFHYRLFGVDANGNEIQGDPEIVNRGV